MEFVLVLPILLMLVFGIVEFGRAYNAKITLTAAAREGARVLALGGTTTQVQQRIKDSAPSLNQSLLTFGPITAPCVAGAIAEVRATYPLAWNIPMVGSGNWDLLGIGAMRCAG